MMKDGKILYMEPGTVAAMREPYGCYTADLTSMPFRNVQGLDERVWQHLLDCAERVAEIESALQITWAEPNLKPAARVQVEPKTKPVCAKCGSDDVRADAYAAWNMDSQEWELTATFDDGSVCEVCGEECDLEWAEAAEGDHVTTKPI